MATMHDLPTSPELLVPTPGARSHRRNRDHQRIRDAAPDLQTDRLSPIEEVLRAYRSGVSPSPLRARRRQVELEVAQLERIASERPRREQSSGPTIRLALLFLKGFGRLSSLDFSGVPVEERSELVALLALEYRWCLAAAGTTGRAFKIAIGRTGAR